MVSDSPTRDGVRREHAAPPAQHAPLRVMQVHSLYPTYVNWYYTQFPQVAQADFATQNKAFYNHGLFAMYIVAPALAELGCETALVYANPKPLQFAWAREHGFALRPDGPRWQWQILAAQIEDYRPDVLFFSDNHLFDGRFLDSLSFRPRFVAAWRSASVDLAFDWRGFDLVLSPLRRIRDLVLHLGAGSARHYIFGYPERLARKTAGIPRDTDVTFCGTYKTRHAPQCHSARRELLEQTALLAARNGITLRLSLSDGRDDVPESMCPYLQPQAFGRDMQREAQRARIGIDCQGRLSATAHNLPILRLSAGDTINMRLFESITFGLLTLTEHRGRLDRYFKPGLELETYASAQECCEKILYYTRHRDEAECIAARGRARYLKEYEQKTTARNLLDIFREELAKKERGERAAVDARVPPAPVLQRLLHLFMECAADGGEEAWEMERTLFGFSCALAAQGHYEPAVYLDAAISEAPFSRRDLGALTAF